ncbi:MAG: phosphoribosylformylglycinamidine cyclo-ligase [Bacteroidota bacterium]
MSTYEQAGVSIKAGDDFVKRIKDSVKSTFTDSVLIDIGGFGAFYDASFKNIENPVLVSSTDGVGTKLKIAFLADRHDSVGQDLVNHCVNDIAVCGAKPLYFLDYFAVGKLNPKIAADVVEGMVKACKENFCSLIGGETAEMPGFYRENEYDLAGTIVGVVPKSKILDGKKVKDGDLLIGLPSTGLHTNGYSLARKVLFEPFEHDDFVDELGMSLGDALLSVHRSYLKPIQTIVGLPALHALSHITGGGIVGNTTRVIPKGLRLKVNWQSWNRPPLFQLIQKYGEVPEEDMRKTFNLGIGLVIITSKRGADRLISELRKVDERPVIIGEIIKE